MQIETRDRLIAYSLLPFLTPSRTRLLREHFESLREAAEAPSRFLQALLSLTPEQAELVKNPLKMVTPQRIESLRERVITLEDAHYPALLREICDPPLALHFRGNPEVLQPPAVAIVGSRRASAYGVNVASRLARDLVSAGAAVVSGLARGIDAAAHRATLDAGGTTLAVLGTGIDITYPRANAKLRQAIEEKGLVLTEFAPGTPPLPENFPMRNRVISGLSLGTVIVEATGRSGSLITARMAAEQGREVFAVPGPIFSANSEGPHRLIQYGAKLVHDANDVLEELPGNLTVKREKAPELEEPLREVLALLRADEGAHVDQLSATLARPPGEIAEALLQLELGGWIRALPGARYVRTGQ